MSLAYLVNQYPLVSHTFIRREIEALEAQGIVVMRFSIRRQDDELTDAENGELAKTTILLEQPVSSFIAGLARAFLCGPTRFFRALLLVLKLGWHSDRGLARHVFYFAEAAVLARLCRARDVTHIHIHFGTNSATVGMIAGQLADVPYSMTIHGPEEFDRPEAIGLSEKLARSKFTAAVSQFGSSQLRRWIGHGHWNKIHVVHCGIEKDFHTGPIAPITGNRFLCIGRLTEQKGHLQLLAAAKLLRERQERFEIVLLGDGPLRPLIEQQIDATGLSGIVRITGWLPSRQVRSEIELCRAVVQPSFAEGLPVAIMEAMALQRPVISTFIAGIPELVVHRETGWLVPAGNTEALAGAMSEALHIPDADLDKMGKTARDRVIERHDIDREVKKLARLFGEAVKSNSHPI